MPTILLLLISNTFMTLAWYGPSLELKSLPLWKVVLISWGIAFLEYCFMVPANRYGSKTFTAFELKAIQEVISVFIFVLFAVFYLKEGIKWNYIVGFLFIIAAVFMIFKKW